ncbi:MAG: FkbM family methyltransferase [Oscillospiraceae bacterium]|nr:FkbM family methyltransferase [Oscillospiraceae bacterium]
MKTAKRLWDIVQRVLVKTHLHPIVHHFGAYIVPNSRFLCGLMDVVDRRECRDEIRATGRYFAENAHRIKENLAILDDEESRRVYQGVIRYRTTRRQKDIWNLQRRYTTIYFDDSAFTVRENEVFFDCGAFFGENASALAKIMRKHGYSDPTVIAVEPDDENFRILSKNLEKKLNVQYYTFQVGVWKEDTTLCFHGNLNSSCKVADDGKQEIAVRTIDSIAAETGFAPTYIKMDIEGCEMEALQGAAVTISRHKPRLAVSIYHSNEHMLEILEYLHAQYPDYKFRVRHYSGSFIETVLYAYCASP